MATPAPENLNELSTNAKNPSKHENEKTDLDDSTAGHSTKDVKNNLNQNRSNDGNSGSPPTDLEDETGQFRGGVAEANSTLMPDDQNNKIPDE
jgi:hypothetical protein